MRKTFSKDKDNYQTMEDQTQTANIASEPMGGLLAKNSVDGLMAYIMSVSPSVTTRRILGRRLLEEADRDADYLKHKAESQIREMASRCEWNDSSVKKPSGHAVRNAIDMIEHTPNVTFLEKVASYPTDHATVMLKWVVGKVVASVDAGNDRFSFAILNTSTAESTSGEGTFMGSKDIDFFFRQLQTAAL
jgi:hypothetical protein